ncbi:hypothetical protein HJC99_01620 [Candidatus Saccharibacteria bacterium]|nr:hypothetical protein [Candidatus Saccharibacteria bacterium]
MPRVDDFDESGNPVPMITPQHASYPLTPGASSSVHRAPEPIPTSTTEVAPRDSQTNPAPVAEHEQVATPISVNPLAAAPQTDQATPVVRAQQPEAMPPTQAVTIEPAPAPRPAEQPDQPTSPSAMPQKPIEQPKSKLKSIGLIIIALIGAAGILSALLAIFVLGSFSSGVTKSIAPYKAKVLAAAASLHAPANCTVTSQTDNSEGVDTVAYWREITYSCPSVSATAVYSDISSQLAPLGYNSANASPYEGITNAQYKPAYISGFSFYKGPTTISVELLPAQESTTIAGLASNTYTGLTIMIRSEKPLN